MVHGGHSLDHAYAAKRTGKIEQHDVEYHIPFPRIMVKVLHGVLRVAFDDRISHFFELFVLAVKGYF